MSVVLLIAVWSSSACASLLKRATKSSRSAGPNRPPGEVPSSNDQCAVVVSSRVGERGQTTAEYALVLIGAAALAFLLISWAAKSDQIAKLFDFVIQHITGNVR